jgi:hypothetical protein
VRVRLLVAALVPVAVVGAVLEGERRVLLGGGAAGLWDAAVAPSSASTVWRAWAMAGPAVADDEVVPVSALAGTAIAITVPPRAASENVKNAAVLTMRVLIM